MFPMYRWLYRQFGFSRSQSNGFLLLLPLTIGFVISAPLYRTFLASRGVHPGPEDVRTLDSLVAFFDHAVLEEHDSLFNFDPNTLPSGDLEKLGIPAAVASRIDRYRQKGGRFRLRRDFARIHGIDSNIFRRLAPFIQLPDSFPRRQLARDREPYYPARQTVQIVNFDLNTADTSQLMAVRGIGPRLSGRIVRFREALGGFVSLDQLREVYALDSLRVSELAKHCFIASGFQAKKLNLNTVARQELADHPYISPRQAGSIVAYRFSHGNFTSIEDLAKIGSIDSVTLSKMRPYLKVE